MSEMLNNTERVEENNANSWDSVSEVPFAGGEQAGEKPSAEKEYLDIVENISSDLEGDQNLGENSINVLVESVGDSHQENLGKMQRAAKILDAEMIRRKSESAYYDAALKLAKIPEGEQERREMFTSARESALERMNAAHTFALEELRKAYPDLSDKEASEKFFGYESWAVNPSELSTNATNGETFDAENNKLTTEKAPANPDRVALINKAVELRSNMHGPAYSENIQDEIGIFRK